MSEQDIKILGIAQQHRDYPYSASSPTLAFAALLTALAACTSGPRSEAVPSEASPSAAGKVSKGLASPEPGGPKPAAPGEVSLPETRVFGIKIPMGMEPAMGPDKVYRFEGTPPMPQVKALVEDQISARNKLREVEGWLFRFARAKGSDGSSSESPLLAIRIFGKGKGSVLDIWVEKNYAEALPDRTVRNSNYTFKAFKKPTRISGMPKQLVDKRRKELGETLRIMQKLEKGEPLTEEEKKSRLFD